MRGRRDCAQPWRHPDDQLRDAEEKLGTALFVRAGKKMLLTPAGERLLESAQRVLNEMKRTEEQIANMDGAAGTIRLCTGCYTCYHWLPAVVESYRKKFPQVELAIDLDATHDPIAR